MSEDSDPLAKARLIAAKLTAKVGGGFGAAVAGGYVSSSSSSTAASYVPVSGTNDTVLGKRRGFGEGEGGASSSSASAGGAPLGGSKRKKIVVPVSQFPDTNFVELIQGANGKTLQALELQTGARLLLRGKGAGSTAAAAAEEGSAAPAEDEDEELHVLVQANDDDTLNSAASIVYDFLYDPPKRAVLQEQQLVVIQQSLMPSPLSKDLEKSNPHTFSLSDALYANDTGFTMMGSRPSGPPGGGGHSGGGGRRDESVKEMEVEADKVGLIIGKGGETIKAIQFATGVYISVNRDPPPDGRPVRTLTLKGTEQQIAAGEIEVTRVGNGGRVGVPGSEGTMGFAAQGGGGGGGGGGYGGGGPRMGGPGLGYGGPGGAAGGGYEEMMSVLAPTIGLVIGRGGETIRGIQDRTGVSVQVQRDDGPDPSLKMIKLVGTPDACARAKIEIETVVAATREMGGQGLGGYQGGGGGYRGGPGGYGGPGVPGMDGPPRGGPGGYGGGGGGGQTTMMLPVPTMATGTIIGRGGEIVKRLEQVSGARIKLGPDQGMETRDVIISGRPDQCDIAKAEIEMIVRARETGAGVIDVRQIGAGGGHGPPPQHYGGGGGGGYGHGGPPQGYGGGGGGYGGGGYGRGPPPGQYGGGGYGGPPPHHGGGGYGGPPPQQQYGGPPQHGGYGGPPPQHQQGPPQHGGYGGPPGHHAPAAHSAPPPPPAAQEEEAPVPPSDPAHFESWWASISTGQQHAYYKKYYPDMLQDAVSRAVQ